MMVLRLLASTVATAVIMSKKELLTLALMSISQSQTTTIIILELKLNAIWAVTSMIRPI